MNLRFLLVHNSINITHCQDNSRIPHNKIRYRKFNYFSYSTESRKHESFKYRRDHFISEKYRNLPITKIKAYDTPNDIGDDTSAFKDQLEALRTELQDILNRAREAATQGSLIAEKEAELRQLAQTLVNEGDEVSARAALESRAGMKADLERTQEKLEVYQSLASKLQEAIYRLENPNKTESEFSSDFPPPRPLPPPPPKAKLPPKLSDQEVEDRFRDIELGSLEASLKSQMTGFRDPTVGMTPVADRGSASTRGRGETQGGEQQRGVGLEGEVSKGGKPLWWTPPVPNTTGGQNASEGRSQLKGILRIIAARKMQGKDPEMSSLKSIRQICQYNDVSASGLEELQGGVPESLFRIAVDDAVNQARSFWDFSGGKNSSDLRVFVCGLAADLGIDDARSVVLISSMIAAHTRSTLLQVSIHVRQYDDNQAKAEMRRLLGVLETFPPLPGSAEMELLAYGLESQIPMTEKYDLLMIARRNGSGAAVEGVAQALGLVVSDEV